MAPADDEHTSDGVAETLPASKPPGDAAGYESLVPVDPDHYADRTELTRGGMGRIVVAQDRRLHRKVAIKELRADSPGLRARFEREARLTARLQHPSIVSVHEAGRWPSGEPFFAMELVAGRSLDAVVSTANAWPERLALLPHVLAVADALAYAHSMRIIHRDLKPHNVLVGEFGETVVIDWGLGKSLDDTAPDSYEVARNEPAQDGATVEGDVLGTPAYMPPEQARGEPVDERADVYAIGAMLYHVLTGKPPYPGLSAAGVLDAVLHEAPVALEKVEPQVAPDLVAIVKRAMSREREARYANARELADDLRRFQAGQLVGAHHYTAGQLARRFIGKPRIAVGIAAAAVISLAVLGTVSIRRIVEERASAQAARTLAEERGALAARRGAAAEELLGFMLGDLNERLEPLGKLDLLETVAMKARDFYQAGDLAGDVSMDPLLRIRARRNVGDVLQSKGDGPGALAEYRAGLAMAEALVARAPKDRGPRMELYEQHYRIAEVLLEQGDVAGAAAAVTAALTVIDALVSEAPSDELQRARAVGYLKRSDIAVQQNDLSRAQNELTATLAVFEALQKSGKASERDLMVVHNRTADILLARGDATASLAELRTAISLGTTYADKDPSDLKRRRDLGVAQRALGDGLQRIGSHIEALASFQASLSTADALVVHDPQNAEWQEDQVQALMRIGEVLAETGELAAAERSLVGAIDRANELRRQHPTGVRSERLLAKLHLHLADVHGDRNNSAGKLAELRAGLTLLESLAARDPKADAPQRDLAVGSIKLADALLETGDTAGALVKFRAALAILDVRHAADPSNTDLERSLSMIHGGIGGSLATQGDFASAIPEFRAALAIDEKLAALDPKDPQAAGDLAWGHANLADVLAAHGDNELARGERKTALALAENVLKLSPTDARIRDLARRLRVEGAD